MISIIFSKLILPYKIYFFFPVIDECLSIAKKAVLCMLAKGDLSLCCIVLREYSMLELLASAAERLPRKSWSKGNLDRECW